MRSGSKQLETRRDLGINYFKDGEPSKYLIKSFFTTFTNSRLNFKPEKLHSEGKANKLYALPAQDEQEDKGKVAKTTSKLMLQAS